jgi:rhamnosyltransferase
MLNLGKTDFKASVIILTKNPGSIFRRVLEAVINQKTSFSYETLIVDSGSVDGSIEYVHSLKDENLRLLEIMPSDFGHGRTRNWAISRSSGKYAVMITHDACPLNDSWLESMVRTAESDSRIAGVFGPQLAYPHASPFTALELQEHFLGFQKKPVVYLDDPIRYNNDVGYRQFLHFFSDSNALVRRAVWEEIPYPNVEFAEDQLWAKQIIEAGWLKAFSENGAVYHSHDLGFFERLQRSFDESFAFKRYFGYMLCSSWWHAIKSFFGLTLRDMRTAWNSKLFIHHALAVASMPIDNLMRVIGHRLGGLAENLPSLVVAGLSRDRRVHSGALKLKK